MAATLDKINTWLLANIVSCPVTIPIIPKSIPLGGSWQDGTVLIIFVIRLAMPPITVWASTSICPNPCSLNSGISITNEDRNQWLGPHEIWVRKVFFVMIALQELFFIFRYSIFLPRILFCSSLFCIVTRCAFIDTQWASASSKAASLSEAYRQVSVTSS